MVENPLHIIYVMLNPYILNIYCPCDIQLQCTTMYKRLKTSVVRNGLYVRACLTAQPFHSTIPVPLRSTQPMHIVGSQKLNGSKLHKNVVIGI